MYYKCGDDVQSKYTKFVMYAYRVHKTEYSGSVYIHTVLTQDTCGVCVCVCVCVSFNLILWFY